MQRFALVLLVLMSCVVAAARASHDHEIAERLRASLADLQHLRESGEVRFAHATAEQRYIRAMRQIELAIQDLGGGLPSQNYRGQAVVLIRQTLTSSHATAAIAALPSFVSKGDHDFLDVALRQLSGSQVPPALVAYYTHPTQDFPDNQRGVAATAIVRSLSASYVNRALATLPGFVPPGDADFCASALNALSSSNVEPVFTAFFAHPPTTMPGNARGEVATLIVQSVSTSYIVACVGTIPPFVNGADVPSIRQIINTTASSRIPQALREFFGTRRG